MYEGLAQYYDALTFDVDYAGMAAFVHEKWQKYFPGARLCLDLACGAGNLTRRLSEKGYDMIGADASADMLAAAQNRNGKGGERILYINQPMTAFELYGTVDAAVCSLDGVNYLTADGELEKLFALLKNYLNPGGVFIFDVNSEYKFRNTLAGATFVYDDGKIFYTWENALEGKIRLCRFDLTFFVKEKNAWRRFDETHTERMYSEAEIEAVIKKSGFSLLEKTDGYSENPAHNASERIVYVVKSG
jgi:SAM-dependent methyltransferase